MKEISNLELWTNTYYFIKAFRCVCSLLYYEENIEKCKYINAQDFVEEKLHKFYINICSLIDIHCEISKNKEGKNKYKKELKLKHPLLNWVFYERDKNAAHKDFNYIPNLDIKLSDLITKMKETIKITSIVCNNILIDDNKYKYINYYKYDPLLFRYIDGITPEIEKKFREDIKSQMRQYIKEEEGVKIKGSFETICDLRQTKNIKDKQPLIIIENGLMGQPYDMLEHRQDGYIKYNAMNDSNWLWITLEEIINLYT